MRTFTYVLLAGLAMAALGQSSAPAGPQGPTGHSLLFKGHQSQVVKIMTTAFSSIYPTGEVTIEAWILPHKLEPLGPNGYAPMTVPAVVALGNMHWLAAGHWTGPGQIAATTNTGTLATAVNSNELLKMGTWQHVAMTYDGQIIRSYLNGALVDQKWHPGPLPLVPTMLTRIGVLTSMGDNALQIDEVRIWGVARSGGQIRRDSRSILAQTTPDLLAYYRFESGKGQIVLDECLAKSHGVLGATDQPGLDDPTWVAGGAPVLP